MSIVDQIARLKALCLGFADEAAATKILGEVSYFRLAAYWLDSMQYGESFKSRLRSTICHYPNIDTAAMGFPQNWQDEPLWKM